jgi:hypothetical protein
VGTRTNTLAFAEATVAGLEVSARFTGFADSPTLRLVYALRNATASDVSVTARVGGNFGSDGSTTIQATSSGDATFDTADRGLVTSDASDPTTPVDPVNTSVFFGPGAMVIPSAASLSSDDFTVDFPVTVPGNATRYLVFFAQMHALNGEAVAAASTFDTNAAVEAAGLLGGLTAEVRGQVLNWALGG